MTDSLRAPNAIGGCRTGHAHDRNWNRIGIDPSTDKAVKDCSQLLDKKSEFTLKRKSKVHKTNKNLNFKSLIKNRSACTTNIITTY